MAKPQDAFVQLPDDSTNIGDKMRTQTKVVGGQIVAEHFYVPSPGLTIPGSYNYQSGNKAVQAAAQDGTTTGFVWLQNPTGSTITALIREIMATLSANAATAAPSAPILTYQKFTFTGIASGAQEIAEPAQTAMTVNQMLIRTAITGMTPTLRNNVGRIVVPAILTAVGVYGGQYVVMPRNPMAWQRGMDLEIAPGEGLVIYQVGVGTASDPRTFSTSVKWDEIDLS